MGMFDQVKEAMKMRSEAKRIDAEIKKISAEYSNGGITVVAKGDMTIEKTQQQMMKAMQGGGMGGLFGK